VQFDNVYFRRDDPNVSSDLEQMPNLLNFLRGQGVLLTNHHTPPDRPHRKRHHHVGNRPVRLQPGQPGREQLSRIRQTDGSTSFSSSFQYWTDKTPDGTHNMLSPTGQNTPAPCVPFTRAGCNFGGVETANVDIENLGDVAKIYGPDSPQAAEVNPHSPNAFPDFVGIAVHYAQGASLCSTANGAVPDSLPSEPSGYANFNDLFGHKYIAPQISNGPLRDLDGNVIADQFNGITTPSLPGIRRYERVGPSRTPRPCRSTVFR
jgi:hypothetical protein